jgi:hypothetical protein
MNNLWDRVHDDLIWDGSLRDIYIRETTLDNWNQFLSVVRETKQYQYFIDGELTQLPTVAVDIFSKKNHQKLLLVWVGEAQLNCHFFAEGEIELDLDPRQVMKQENFEAIGQFMEQLAIAIQRSVLLTPENLSEHPIIQYEPESKSWQYFPTIQV